jgi:hypothetical protein
MFETNRVCPQALCGIGLVLWPDVLLGPTSFGPAAVVLAHNVRTRAEVDPLIRSARRPAQPSSGLRATL